MTQDAGFLQLTITHIESSGPMVPNEPGNSFSLAANRERHVQVCCSAEVVDLDIVTKPQAKPVSLSGI